MTHELIHYLAAHALTAALPLAIGILVATQRPRLFLFRIFLIYNLTISWWAFFTLFMEFAPNASWALLWDRVSLIGIAFIPSTFLHFTLVFLRKNKVYQRLVQVAYFLSAVFTILSFTPLMLGSVSRKHFVPYFTDPGPAYPFFLTFFALVMGLALFYSYQAYLERRGTSQARPTLYFFLVAFVAVMGGGGNFFVPYDVFIPLLIPYGSYGVVIYAVMTAYLIVMRRFLEIEVIIKKTLVFTGLFAMVMVVVGVVMTLSQTFIGRALSLGPVASTALSVFIAILFYEPTYSLLVNLTDHFLFQKKESIKEILRRLSERIITILDLGQVARTILETFSESLRAEAGTIFMKDERDYKLLKSYGVSPQADRDVLGLDDPLAGHLLTNRQLINLEDEQSAEGLSQTILGKLERLKAKLAIPLFLHGELIGLLTLGKKKSDQAYSREEIEYFPTVAGQVAIALSNARLYGEAVEGRKKIEEMQLELIHREKMAFVADLVKGIAHEVFNPLLPVFYKIDELQKDVLVALFEIFKTEEKNISPTSRDRFWQTLKQHRDATEDLKVNAQHIHLVIDTLNKMQKEDKDSIGPLDLKTFLKDSRALIGMELHSEGREIPIEEDVPRGLPPVKGNPTLLAQVFVNLFKNAIHAMEEGLEKKITIRAGVDPEDEGFLKIDFSDTGRGIPADILPRIFDFGFTTKGEKGQGIGLSQCKLIIEKFGGSIQCTSQAGGGTTFTLRLPIWQGGRSENLNRG